MSKYSVCVSWSLDSVSQFLISVLFFLVWPEARVALYQFRVFLRFCFEIQVIRLLSRNCSLLPFHGVFSLVLLSVLLFFFRLSSSAARLFSLISFALLPFWAFFMVTEPRVCGRESDSRPCLRLSLVFSTFPDLFHNMPYFFLSFLLFPLAPQFFYAKDCDIGSPCCIP